MSTLILFSISKRFTQSSFCTTEYLIQEWTFENFPPRTYRKHYKEKKMVRNPKYEILYFLSRENREEAWSWTVKNILVPELPSIKWQHYVWTSCANVLRRQSTWREEYFGECASFIPSPSFYSSVLFSI